MQTCPVEMLTFLYYVLYQFLSDVLFSPICWFFAQAKHERNVWHDTSNYNNPHNLHHFFLSRHLSTPYLTRGYVRLWYSKSTGWEILGSNWSWKQCNGFPIIVLYSVGRASIQLELLTDSVFLVGIWLVFLGFYQTNTGGKLGRYISVLTWRNRRLPSPTRINLEEP
jgi:hypothetical protein